MGDYLECCLDCSSVEDFNLSKRLCSWTKQYALEVINSLHL